MPAPKRTQDLAEQLEVLVTEYIAEGHRAAQQALERAFSASATKSKRPASKTPKRSTGPHRSPKQIAELGERLYELVCAQPGESMVVFAAELGESVCALQRPMFRLKRAGRVRTVGQRHQTRYFPAANGRARARS